MALPKEKLEEIYKSMFLIRKVEEKVVELYPEQQMKCPTHLYIGEEAIAAGVCSVLKKEDIVFTNHRSHGHYLGKGGNLKKLFAEIYGKKTGCAKGYGGSMHVIDRENGVWGGSAIVGGAIPIATGAALSVKMKKKNNVVVSFFGDGAVEEGVFHESLNFASLHKLPVIYVCENNFIASQTLIWQRESNTKIFEKAAAYNMPGIRVDGTDVFEVRNAAMEACARAQNGEGPTLIEAVAYRWKAHVGLTDDYEMGHRTKEELEEWKKKCPIGKFEDYLLKERIFSKVELEAVSVELSRSIEEAVKFAKESECLRFEEICQE